MELLTTLENQLRGLYARTPTMPASWRAWITKNIWFIVKIFAILGAIGLGFIIFGLLAALLVNGDDVVRGSMAMHELVPSSTAVLTVDSLIQTVLYFAAIAPLREKRYKGWRLLFICELVSTVTTVGLFVISAPHFDVISLVWSLFITALILYVLFQIRDDFGSRLAEATEAEIVTKPFDKKKTDA